MKFLKPFHDEMIAYYQDIVNELKVEVDIADSHKLISNDAFKIYIWLKSQLLHYEERLRRIERSLWYAVYMYFRG